MLTFSCAVLRCVPICIGNHTVFLVQFGINLYERVFQKAEIARAASASAISLFEKLTSANQFQIEREKPYDYLLII